jgi:hypothetical protein
VQNRSQTAVPTEAAGFRMNPKRSRSPEPDQVV